MGRRLRLADRVLAALMLAAALLSVPARADPPPTVVIIVDITQILRESKAAKAIQQQLDKESAAYSREVAQQENELQQRRDELDRQRTQLPPDAFSAKTREFQELFDTLDRNVQNKRVALQQALNDAMAKVQAATLQIIQEVAKERRASLVLTKQAALFEDDSLDVTKDVMGRLDARLPSVTVELPTGGSALELPKGDPAAKK
jgi:outer membrane protein